MKEAQAFHHDERIVPAGRAGTSRRLIGRSRSRVWFGAFAALAMQLTAGGSNGGNSGPFAITLGPDGNLWFTELDARKIGRITPEGVMTEFVIPSGASPGSIAAGKDGNLWFTAAGSDNSIGRVTPEGTCAAPRSRRTCACSPPRAIPEPAPATTNAGAPAKAQNATPRATPVRSSCTTAHRKTRFGSERALVFGGAGAAPAPRRKAPGPAPDVREGGSSITLPVCRSVSAGCS